MHHENAAFRFDADLKRRRRSRSVPMTDCRASCRRRTATTGTRRTGIGTSCTARNWSAAWMPSRIWRRRVNSAGRCRRQAIEAIWRLRAAPAAPADDSCRANTSSSDISRCARAETQRRSAFATPLDRSADAYLVRRGAGRTIIAGYPWFTDWGRDTFIAVRGLCLATGRLSDARDILVEWAGAVSEGMLPNRFPDHGEAPEFNAVDASLWYVDCGKRAAERSRAADRRSSPATIGARSRPRS